MIYREKNDKTEKYIDMKNDRYETLPQNMNRLRDKQGVAK